MERSTLYDKIYACWLGKNIGGTLGTPVEGRKEVMHLTWYPRLDPKGALPNDDLDLQLVNLHAMEQGGVHLNAAGIATEWTEHVYFPWDEYGYSGTAMRMGFKPPFSGTFDNHFTDCMGSPIRSEIWAAICAGKPRLAAYFAWQDAVVDHAGGEGVFGEIFNAALEAAAYESQDVPALIREALSYIPETCRVHQAVSHMLALYQAGTDLPTVREIILRDHGRYNFTDAPQNIAFGLAGLLWGENFEDAILKVVNLGYDTDCTVATCGAILGILYGRAGIPAKWSAPIGDTIQVSAAIRGFAAPANLAELTDRCLSLYDKLSLEDPAGYVITPEDNADFAVQHHVLPAGSRPGEGVTFDLRYVGSPVVAPEQPASVRLTVTNHTTWPWHTELSFSLPEGLLPGEGLGQLELAPGQTVERTLTVLSDGQGRIPQGRVYPVCLVVRRFNDNSFWSDYRIPFTLLAPNRWTLCGTKTLIPGCTVQFPERTADGVYVAEAVLTTPVQRMTRLFCNTESPVTVTVDGTVLISTDTEQPFLPAYHRVPAAQRWDGDLSAGAHRVRVEIRTAPGAQPPRFVIGLNAPATVSEPGNFYAYIDDHFAAEGK
jgi:ADP-ribosylglycohydrolase